MYRKIWGALALVALWTPTAARGDLTVTVTWNESPPPEEGQDYRVDRTNIWHQNVTLITGSQTWQIYSRVIIPAILPGLLMVLRLNLLGAWMVVLVAEATGVGYGLGQVIMLGRNTFNPSLVFFTIVLIGLLGFSCDWIMRMMQRKLLYWVPRAALRAPGASRRSRSCRDRGRKSHWHPQRPRSASAPCGAQ